MNQLGIKKKTDLNSPALDVVVIGARAEERQALASELARVSDSARTNELQKKVGGLVFALPSNSGKEGEEDSVISVGVVECAEMGNVSAAINTAYAIMRYEPSLVIFSGIAGSLDSSSFRIGDVILPRTIRTRFFQKLKTIKGEYDSLSDIEKVEVLKQVNGDLQTRDYSIAIPQTARDILLHVNADDLSSALENVDIPSEWISKHGIPGRAPRLVNEEEAFSWDKVLSNKDYVSYLRGEIKSAWTTVDMESYGFLRSIDKLRSLGDARPYASSGLVIRAVSDFAQYKDLSDSDPKWRRLGLKNMAIATRFVIQNTFLKVF